VLLLRLSKKVFKKLLYVTSTKATAKLKEGWPPFGHESIEHEPLSA